MEALRSRIFESRPDAIKTILKLYGMDQPGALSDAVDILQEWIKKQAHFIKKDFDTDFLKKLIIRSKGSVEISKQRLDKMCTSRTLMPTLFVICNAKDVSLQYIEESYLPRYTHVYYRVYMLRNVGQSFDSNFCSNYCRRLISIIEFGLKVEYFVGIVLIFDFRQTNLLALLKSLNLVEIQQILTMITESYGVRVKGIHMIAASKAIESMVGIFKRFLSAKVGSRIHVHNTFESLHEHVEKDILPKEYGGTEMPLAELHKQLLDVINSEEHMEYMKMMNAAGTNEALRTTERYNEQVLGMPGSFRALRVD